ncbi:dihydrofolate reductase family protein [Chitinophaga flava]|uniref:Riboflavin biosynthesis protein RibD n=1 Tax=Chitinophaga flava TaxID=2259036 RepID=A0A365XTV5_9BACT|nr:dihydrofolate reductase family protein [Chitinophaga flava]RBL89807.1 riboflavin biosynthesis protein RibD [Chitinophaga flava]
MRKIIISTFLTLDGVLQAPGGPQEDTAGGFQWGGWSATYWDELMNQAMGSSMSQPFDLLLGRKTYEIFAAHWPYMQNDPTADLFNRIEKFVVSSKPQTLSWQNSTLVTGDVVAGLRTLKLQQGHDLLVNGSGKLIQTLLANDLADRLHIWTFPVTIGSGKRLFAEGTQPGNWELLGSTVSSTGVIMTSYQPGGPLKSGSFALEPPTEAELARRKKVAAED